MFTGIVQAVGCIRRMESRGGDQRFCVSADKLNLSDVCLGDSIATNGVCLTVIDVAGGAFVADVSNETLTRSTLSRLKIGSPVNLEKAMQPTSRFGGHMVSGHVDGIGEIRAMHQDGRSLRFTVAAPDALAKYIAEKGSITVDGVSLTVNAVDGALFELNIVPHTVAVTALGEWHVGSLVNLEVDIIARYLERLLLGERAATPGSGGISLEFLAEHGFMK